MNIYNSAQRNSLKMTPLDIKEYVWLQELNVQELVPILMKYPLWIEKLKSQKMINNIYSENKRAVLAYILKDQVPLVYYCHLTRLEKQFEEGTIQLQQIAHTIDNPISEHEKNVIYKAIDYFRLHFEELKYSLFSILLCESLRKHCYTEIEMIDENILDYYNQFYLKYIIM